MFNSTKLANTRKAIYIKVQVKPIFQSNRNLLTANEMYKPNNVDNSDMAEYVSPVELSIIYFIDFVNESKFFFIFLFIIPIADQELLAKNKI